MKTLIFFHLPVIDTRSGGYYFFVFYLLAFSTAITVFVFSCKRHRIPFRTILLMVGAGVIFFILGNKLFAISPAGWGRVFTDPDSCCNEGRTVLGGIAGLGAALFVCGKWLGLKNVLSDRLALALPLGMIVARAGCLMAGCCFGMPTSLPWGIRYGAASAAFASQLHCGLVSISDVASLPVHPVPVYEMIACALIALVVWITRRFWKASGSRLVFTVLLYGTARFFLEFFRDPFGDKFAGVEFLGIKYVQWAVLSVTVLLGLFLWIRERKVVDPSTVRLTVIQTGDARYISLAVFLLVLFTAAGT
ncbi:MAG TPA: prolipoprotein diacylglyceryl transferase family protein, partial [Bacteroidales bacterium]|nr:prolipoprotein diacylglyceryl transferase family protein [Bacteroidales bacterium]